MTYCKYRKRFVIHIECQVSEMSTDIQSFLFQQNIALVSNIHFWEEKLTNKRNYGNIHTKHVSLFTYYFVFVVPVHQHFALIQYIYERDFLYWMQSNLDIFHVDISLWLSDKILQLPNTKNINTLYFLFSLHISAQNTCLSTKNIFITNPKVMSKSIQSAWQLVIIQMTLIISVCFKLEQHFYYN